MKSVAIIYCEGAMNTPYGKTAHGLVRFTERYEVVAVIDSRLADKDAGAIIDGKPNGVPVVEDLASALSNATSRQKQPTHFVIGLAPDGGRLPESARSAIRTALESGLNVDSGLHDFLSDDGELASMASLRGLKIHDVRKPPPRSELHFFSGKIEQVDSLKIAVLGTDSAIGKRTTAWILVHAFRHKGWADRSAVFGRPSHRGKLGA